MQETRVRFLGQENPLEKEMETHSSILAWRIPWTKEPCGLQSMGSQELDIETRERERVLSSVWIIESRFSSWGNCSKQFNLFSLYQHLGGIHLCSRKDNDRNGNEWVVSSFDRYFAWGEHVLCEGIICTWISSYWTYHLCPYKFKVHIESF